MSHSIVVKSFAELADILDLDTRPEETAGIMDEQCPRNPDTEPSSDLASLLAELEAASATLATISRQDQETRAVALRDLAQYDALVAEQRQTEQVLERAGQVRREAEALVAQAFAEEARAAAAQVAALAAKAEANAATLAEQRRRDAERLAGDIDLERLLAERRWQDEAEKAKAAAAEQAGRLSGALARARAALEAGRFEEAHAVLGSVANENPDNAEIASLLETIIHRETAVKVAAAEDALWLARRTWRHDPEAAVKQLAALDVAGLPAEIGRQVFGTWAQACARLCHQRGLIEPLRYAPTPGRGAILAREQPGAPYTVISALGLDATWQSGSTIGEHQVQRARPLR